MITWNQNQPHPNVAFEAFIESAAYGLKGLALRALLSDGGPAATAAMLRIERGQAFVEIEVRIGAKGVSALGSYCSHGTRAQLFDLAADGNLLGHDPTQVEGDDESLLRAAQVGLFGLMNLAFLKAGKVTALKMLDALEDGSAQVRAEVIYSQRGAAFEGWLSQHGSDEKTHLFSVTAHTARLKLH